VPKSSTSRKSAARVSRKPRPSGISTFVAALLILACGFLAYSNSFAGVFVFDDEPAIVQNPYIKRLWPVTDAMRAPAGTTVSGRPLVSLSLAMNYALSPAGARDVLTVNGPGDTAGRRDELLANLWGYHTLNLAIHLGTALAIFGVLRRTFRMPALAERTAGHADGLALATTLLWTVHPLLTGAVTYVIQRAESLMGMLLMLTLYCAIRARDGARGWTAAAIACCALGMMTKETMVVAPLIVVLWDWIFGEQGSMRRRVPLYAGLAATWIVLALLVAGNHRPNAAGFAFADWPWWRYFLTQSAVVTHYLRLAVVPFPLVLDYDWLPARLPGVLPYLVLMIGLVVMTFWAAVRRWPSGFAGGVFFLVLGPTSSVLPIVTEVAAEHRMYVPLAAVLALLVAGGFEALRRLWPARAVRIGAIATALLLVAGAALTYARNADYHDFDRIWLDTIARRPANARARNNYATSLLAQGRLQEAEEHARVAVTVSPRSVEAQQTLGVALCAQGRCGEGMPHLEAAAAIDPTSPDIQRNLAEADGSSGRMAEAAAHYLRALEARPDDVRLLNRAGWILATDRGMARDGRRAVTLAEHAVQLTARQDVESLDTLAAAYAEVGRFDEATATASEALRLAPSREPAIVPELEQRLALYRAGKPFRQ
jgi:tetratricopeptide (TPR) repeat protein